MKKQPADDDKKRAAQVANVLTLYFGEALSIRAIAKRLQISRKRVSRLVGQAPDRAALAKSRRAEGPGPRPSILAPYLPAIKSLLDDTPDLRAPAVLERLRARGYPGGISVVRDCLRTLRPPPAREAFLTLDFLPGAAAQVDWADFGYAIPGCPRRVSAFVMVLCYSRYLYLEFTVSQSMGTFLRCLERAAAFFAGLTAMDIFDNMRTVVKERSRHGVVFNPRMLDYARTRGGFALTACNPRSGHEKGRVERPIGFVRDRFWPGRRFVDLADINRQAFAWRDSFANGRVHEGTGKVPHLVFEGEERRLLKPLPPTPVDVDDIETQTVNKSFRVSFDRNRYSVPWRLVGQTVVLRADDQAVAVFLGTKQVARHARCWAVGQDIKHPSHEEGLLDHKPRAQSSPLPAALVDLGADGERYFKILGLGGRSLVREAQRLTFLVEIYGARVTADAVREVLATGHVGAEYVEYIVRHKKTAPPAPPPLRLGNPALDEMHFSEPDLGLYDQLVSTARTADPGSALHLPNADHASRTSGAADDAPPDAPPDLHDQDHA